MPQTIISDKLRARLGEFETRVPADFVKVDEELVHTLCGQVVCDVEDGDALSALVDTAVEHTCPESMTLGLHNRPEVIAFIDGEFHPARQPDDPGSDVVVIDLIDRMEVVINGETVTRTDHEFRIGRDDTIRTRFPRIATASPATPAVVDVDVMDGVLAEQIGKHAAEEVWAAYDAAIAAPHADTTETDNEIAAESTT